VVQMTTFISKKRFKPRASALSYIMDKFLLAENPMRPESGLWVIHLLTPVAIIRCTEVKEAADEVSQDYVYINSDNVAEQWTLSIYFTEKDIDEEELYHLLDRAWRWYRSYMQWEDKNIDTNEEANEN
jgi:hypothetical protein